PGVAEQVLVVLRFGLHVGLTATRIGAQRHLVGGERQAEPAAAGRNLAVGVDVGGGRDDQFRAAPIAAPLGVTVIVGQFGTVIVGQLGTVIVGYFGPVIVGRLGTVIVGQLGEPGPRGLGEQFLAGRRRVSLDRVPGDRVGVGEPPPVEVVQRGAV